MPKGFAHLTPEQRAEIGSLGGKASVAGGTAHRWTPEEARAFSLKGIGKVRMQARLRRIQKAMKASS